MDSILNTVKKHLGISDNYNVFDIDIIDDINYAIDILTQLGVNYPNTYRINGSTELWSDYVTDARLLGLCQTYIIKKVKLLFDPPTNSVHINSINQILDETTWRIHEYLMSSSEGGN